MAKMMDETDSLDLELKTELPLAKRIRFFLARFRHLPMSYWAALASIFGVADFLTWSVLADILPLERVYWTLGIAAVALGVTIFALLRTPTSDEKMGQARALHRVGREAYASNRYAEAKKCLRRAVELDPEEVSNWGVLGRVLVRLGELSEAIPALTRAIELTQVNRALYLHNRGVAYASLGQYGRALDDFEESLRGKPNRIITLRWRGLVWLYLGRLDNALNDIDAALKLQPRYLCGHATKAIVLYRLGQIEKAEKELSRCSSLQPEDADDFYCLALAYSQAQELHQALQMLRLAIERDPKYPVRAKMEPLFERLRNDPAFQSIVSQGS
jgi:tetratricopeptide (TPR) repeat protein